AGCCGWVPAHFSLFYDPLGIPVGDGVWQGVEGFDGCINQYDDATYLFENGWSTANQSIATVDTHGLHTGMGVGSTTTLVASQPIEIQVRPNQCLLQQRSVSGNDNTISVTIGIVYPDPIAVGGSGSVQVTVNPSSNIVLTISSSGTGAATFTNGTTTTNISATTNVTIQGVTASQSAFDLTLAATLPNSSTELAFSTFTVSSGHCDAAFTQSGGDGIKVCPTEVSVYNDFNITNYCSTCTATCQPAGYDSSFSPVGCGAVYSGGLGHANWTLRSTAQGNFTKIDCNEHLLHINTTIVNAQGVPTLYQGGTIGLECQCP
ncbi:MAG TPA: hypothetical protein VMV61_09610, partial [Patescibacteria group bacterium]|nr:hypothetical protein [Patescibacteria group bacterium]